MAKVKYYAKENSSIGTHSFYAVPSGQQQSAKRGAGGIETTDFTDLTDLYPKRLFWVHFFLIRPRIERIKRIYGFSYIRFNKDALPN